MNGRMAGYTDDRGSSGFLPDSVGEPEAVSSFLQSYSVTVYSDSDLALDKLFVGTFS